MACIYFRVLFLACDGRRRGDPNEIAIEHMDMTFDSVKYFTDSRVVLGYIHNDKRRFLCMYQTELTEFEVSVSRSSGNL